MPSIGSFRQFLKTGALRSVALGASHAAVCDALGLPQGAKLPDEPWLNSADWYGYGLLNFKFTENAVELIGLSYMTYLEDVGILSSRGPLHLTGVPESAPSITHMLSLASSLGLTYELSPDPSDTSKRMPKPPEFFWKLSSNVYIFGRREKVISICSRSVHSTP